RNIRSARSTLFPYTTLFRSQFGISPSYKWIKLHLGYRNISFSPLVFDGQSFMGTGIELTPKNLYFGAFYGRLNKAISEENNSERDRKSTRLNSSHVKISYAV